MIDRQWAAASAALGIGFAGLVAMPHATQAATITRVPGNFAHTTPNYPTDWENLNWVGRGRASAPGDWEFGVSTDVDINNPVQQSHWNWTSGQDVSWNLLWDAAENKVTFNIGGSSLVLDQPGQANGIFNGFFLWTTSRSHSSKVAPGTEMLVQVDTVNGMAVDPSVVNSSAVAPAAGQVISKFFFASDEAITSMSGIARMSWPDGGPNPQTKGARDRVGFKIEGFYQPVPVPEPASVLGLLAFGAVAVAGRNLKKRF
ncbi:MAG: choice-of-anchor W domain-containing protein [Cyanobacteriota bacterium]|nr:choice-of-anchor W domain-containing protein [Cyanobacteriota bacterium]